MIQLGLGLALTSLIVGGLVYLGIVIIAFRQSALRGRTANWLTGYAALALAGAGLLMSAQLGALAGLRADFVERLPGYSLLALAILFVYLSRSFLRLTGPDWRWLAVGVIGGAAALVLDLRLFALAEVWGDVGGLAITLPLVILSVLLAGWAVMVGAAAWLTRRVYHHAQQSLHRNRIIYWVFALGLLVVGDGLLFTDHTTTGIAVRTLGICLAAYAVLVFNLPDVRQMVRRVLSYLIAITLAILFYAGAFFGAQMLLQALPPYVLLAAATALAVALALGFSRLLRGVRSVVNRIIFLAAYDPGRAVREYSVSISNILELSQLASVALAILQDAFGARSGALLLVDHDRRNGTETLRLRSVGTLNTEIAAHGALSEASPLVEYLRSTYRPLTQYDIDLQPRFQTLAADERAWFSGLGMDVYVPIYAKGEWSGLFALGPKASRDRYFDDDLTILSTLADQTSVALENARLVDNLRKLNRDLRTAYDSLDKANRQLEQLDRAKSDFIAVLSHELRTPLGVLLGYSQMLAEDPDFQEQPDRQMMVGGLQKGAVRLQEIIEAMLDMAMIDNRTLRLYHKPGPIGFVMAMLTESLAGALAERRQTLTVKDDIRRLPDIECDGDMLGKAFYHIVVNAIKYTPDGGRITISGRELEAGNSRLPEGGIEVVVSDTGIGIDAANHELIFDKFYQTGEVALHSSGKTKFKGGGPGLGLAIAKGIIEAHGGKIWVESPGHDETKLPGSHFHVALPLRQPGRPVALPAL
jgi:signal transduction histidine kinase